MRVAIIGGGPSGLVTLKYLKTAHKFFPDEKHASIEVMLFEAENNIGGTFRHRAYEDAEVSVRPQCGLLDLAFGLRNFDALTLTQQQLVSSRQLTTFSDFRYPADAPDFLSAEE